MTAINSDNAHVWQDLANEVSKERPSPGKRVLIEGGRKHRGKEGIVLRHTLDKFDSSAFRYGGEANLHLREMRGRSGFVVLVRSDSGEEFWVKADYTKILS